MAAVDISSGGGGGGDGGKTQMQPRQSIAKCVFGPPTWKTMHAVAYGFPPSPTAEERQAAEDLVNSFQYLMPCKTCRDHYAQLLREHPISAASHSRDAFIRWTIDRHNDVNKRLNKPVWSYEDVDAVYAAPQAQCSIASFLSNPSSNEEEEGKEGEDETQHLEHQEKEEEGEKQKKQRDRREKRQEHTKCKRKRQLVGWQIGVPIAAGVLIAVVVAAYFAQSAARRRRENKQEQPQERRKRLFV